MNLAELKEAYKARKLALDSAKKEEEKYKELLKDAMLEAGESDYTDDTGFSGTKTQTCHSKNLPIFPLLYPA